MPVQIHHLEHYESIAIPEIKTCKTMKKVIVIVVAMLGYISFGQSSIHNYMHLGKLSTAEIAQIDTSDTNVIYTAYDTSLGIEVINKDDGNGWVARFDAATGADALGPDGDKGDITVGGSGTTLTVNDGSINSAKIEDGSLDLSDLSTALVTYIDAKADGTGTDDQTASEVPFSPNGSIAATNVQAAIQEVRDEAGGIAANDDAFSGTALTDGYTFQGSDFTSGRNLFYYDGSADIEVNVASDIASAGEKLQIWQYGTGKVQLALDAALDGISFQTVDNTNPVTLTKQFGSFGYRPVGNWDTYTSSIPSPSAGNTNPELNSGNASSFQPDESASVPTWIEVPVNANATVSTDGLGYGDNSLEVIATSTSFGRTRHRFTVIDNATYEYFLTYEKDQGTQGRFRILGVDSTVDILGLSANSPTLLSGEVVADGTTIDIEVWAQSSSGGTTGDNIRYKLSFKEK